MKIIPSIQFVKDLKQLSKKYTSLTNDIRDLQAQLLINPTMGESLGKSRYKVRLNIKSKKQGKSGGGRVITYVEIQDDEMYLLTMYDKAEMENVNDAFLDDLVKKLER